MNTNHNVEEKITEALQDYSNQIHTPSALKQKIDRDLDHKIMEGTMKSRWNFKKCVILVAACCLILSMGVFAAGNITGYVSSLKPDKTYNSYKDLDKAKETAGFDFDSVESFSNGYSITRMNISETDKTDDDFNRLGSFKEWHGIYENKDGESIDLYAYPTQPETEARTPDATIDINGITVSYYVDHYKFVPEDYELTDEDLANDGKDNYFISVGSDEFEECDYTSVSWQNGDISYYFLDENTELNQEELFQMASEVITP